MSVAAQRVRHPAARVRELAASGYTILSSRVTAIDSDGFAHSGVALYSLAERRQPSLFDGGS
ncbi:helix-turn-helix domain-containing protein [Paraburkholderia ginsengisoli]